MDIEKDQLGLLKVNKTAVVLRNKLHITLVEVRVRVNVSNNMESKVGCYPKIKVCF